MDHAACHVVYVDSRISQDLDGRHIQKARSRRQDGTNVHEEGSWEDRNPDCLKAILGEIEEVRSNLRNVLSVFNGVHTCISGNTCMKEVAKLDSPDINHHPLLVILGTPTEAEVDGQSSESSRDSSSTTTDLYGPSLLQHICTEICSSSLSKLVVPIAMIHRSECDTAASRASLKSRPPRPSSGGFSKFDKMKAGSMRTASKIAMADPQRTIQYVELGAIDVLMSPLQVERLHYLTVHAHRARKEAVKERSDFLAQKKSRKLSWLGNSDNKPYAYLREKMVSELMTGICNPDEALHIIDHRKLPDIEPAKEAHLKKAIGSWGYSGHDYSEDELIHAACFMLQHALALPELEKWRLPPADLKTFLMASRAAYNGFVNYHNFRHVVDVMQAIFYFLLRIGTLPSYSTSSDWSGNGRRISPVAALLKPFDALTLLITAIGHDVGHPGVNNAFLVALNAPLAQLYNDRSVLEAFHCAAYSQILRRYWRAAFEDIPMRSLMINSILATDMGVHGKYMSDLANLQGKLHQNGGTDGLSVQILDEYRVLTCALLVKCADISNVARPFDVAVKWANILQLEFANQGVMEREVGIPTALFGGPPELGNLIKLANSQISFMNMFARPLFEAVTDVLPAMVFAVDELKGNHETWTEKIRKHTARDEAQYGRDGIFSDGFISPRSWSPNNRTASQPELSHPEGLPASNPSPQPLESPPTSQPADSPEARRASASSIPQHLGSNDPNIQTYDTSRRSSTGIPLDRVGSTPHSAASFSRRSSGALSASNVPLATVTTRRSSNTSPSQLQLRTDSRSQTSSSVTSENRQPNGRASEDTLSQTRFANGTAFNGGGGGDVNRRSSKGNVTDYMCRNAPSANESIVRSYSHSGHHRSSSGAHTNNTTMSQSVLYSPTGTQATSVLTVDSDEKSSQGRVDSWSSPERRGIPDLVNVDRPGSSHRFDSMTEFDGVRDIDVKTSVHGNGSMGGAPQRTVGRKGSRFNFNFWKKKGKGIEASP